MPPARRGRSQRRPPGTRPPQPAAPGSNRAGVERRSGPLLAYIARLPRWVPFVIILGLGAVGLFVSGPVGGAALAVVALFLGWLAYLSWPALTPFARLLRVAAVAILLAAAVAVTF